ncbi:hypothetical protein ATCC90586_009444 [Pythium insidiosum]|nr:hypothetical protein ATCC90586_009444 [Pythium insidiosum]
MKNQAGRNRGRASPQVPTQDSSATLKRNSSFKSSAVELEVELAERLNEIERSKLSEKVESRYKASQKALQQIIQQDEHADLDDDYGDDLEDVQLCPEIDDDLTKTPSNVPQLNFAALSPYDQEDEEDDCYDDVYSEDLQYQNF